MAGGLVAGADMAGLSRKSQGAELGLLLKIATHAGPESAIDDATGRQRYQVITLSL